MPPGSRAQRSNSVSQAIKKAWEHRFLHDLEQVDALLPLLRDQARCDSGSLVAAQVELLEISLLRARGELSAAQERIQEFARKNLGREPYQYFLQRALNAFAEDEFALALEFFLVAESKAHGKEEVAIALMNVLLCLENLNLPWQSPLQKLEDLLAKVGRRGVWGVVQGQYQAFRLRQAFRFADFAYLLQNRPHLALGEMDQSTYYRLWLSCLPYLQVDDQEFHELLPRLVMSRNFYRKNYRLKTLLADQRLTQGDGAATIPQQVDRLYLWTWRWLAEPTEATRKNLAQTLGEFDFAAALRKVTFEDFQMLHNALGWIAFFQPSLKESIENYLSRFSIRGQEWFPIFAFERLCLQSCREGRADERLLKHPLYQAPLLRFRDWLSEWREVPRVRRQTAALVICPDTFEIKTSGQTLVSRPLSHVLAKLVETLSMSFAEALWLGFEIAPYDPDVHLSKVHNLSARLKKVLPARLQLSSKEKRLYLRGDLRLVEVQRAPAHGRPLFEQVFDFTRGCAPQMHRDFQRPLHPREVVARARGRRTLTREQLQELTHLPKASCVRWLKRWQDRGLIQRQGVGRGVVYHIDIVDQYRITPSV